LKNLNEIDISELSYLKIDTVDYNKLVKDFSEEDSMIFPLSLNPHFYKQIEGLYLILSDKIVLGFIYTLNKKISYEETYLNEVGIYIYPANRNAGIGKKAILNFKKIKSAFILHVSKDNSAMYRMMTENAEFSIIHDIPEYLICKVE
jgi:predicted acetyltransferase